MFRKSIQRTSDAGARAGPSHCRVAPAPHTSARCDAERRHVSGSADQRKDCFRPRIHLSMADTGSGMDEATLARALEPFFSTKDVGNPMNKVIDCRAMELWCIERAKVDPKNSWKWLGQAERWQELGHSQVACRFRPAKCPVHHPRLVEAFEWGRA
jgi:hypothetical protein